MSWQARPRDQGPVESPVWQTLFPRSKRHLQNTDQCVGHDNCCAARIFSFPPWRRCPPDTRDVELAPQWGGRLALSPPDDSRGCPYKLRPVGKVTISFTSGRNLTLPKALDVRGVQFAGAL